MTIYATVEQNLAFEEKTLVRYFFDKEDAPKGALIVENLPIRDNESANFITTDLLITDTKVSYTPKAWEQFKRDLENHEEF